MNNTETYRITTQRNRHGRVSIHEGLVKCLVWYRKALGKSVKMQRSSGASQQPS